MLNLVPFPSGKVTRKVGQLILPKTIQVDYNGFSEFCTAAFLERICAKNGATDVFLHLIKNSMLPHEAYALAISEDGIKIEAAGEQGVIWALTTVLNLADKGKVPCCRIEDSPRYPHRGVHLDCARHFFPAEEVMRVIEAISLAKLNVLHWHLSDDQGWRIESKRFPMLTKTSKDFFTQEEIKEICKYAQKRGVEIIPEIDMPGHTSALLAAYPDLSCSGKQVTLARCGGIYPVILCAGSNDVISFLSELLEELCTIFPDPRFHIGGDEAPKSEWKKCPKCTQRMKELGIVDYEDLQADFSQRVSNIVRKYGKQPICWNETLRASAPPEDIQIQYWTLQHRSSMEAFTHRGGKWIYSDMFELYFDYPHSMTSLKKVYHITPHLGKVEKTFKDGVLGMESCLWAEHIQDGDRLESLLFPRIFALAEITWCEQRDYNEFVTRLEAQLKNSVYGKYSITPRSWWDPKGAARRKEAIAYFTTVNSGMSADVRAQTVESAAPNREFAQSFMNKFFEPLDIPFLLISMLKKK